MPIQPPISIWDMASVAASARAAPESAEGAEGGRRDDAASDMLDGDLVAVGADLAPGTLLSAYRQGLFPMPSEGPGSTPSWWMPQRRGVLPLSGLVVSRSLRRSARDFDVRLDTAFADVLAACGDPDRTGAWIDGPMAAAYTRLHEMGWAHSVEAWQDDRLVGGLYGVSIGGLFAGESMFHRVKDASKVALMGLVELLVADGDPRRLLDVQWQTPHLATLGVIEVSRTAYLERLAVALEAPLPPALA